jgi:hypothetical protein
MASKKQGGSRLTTSSVGSSQHGLFIIDDETLTDPRVRDLVFCPVVDGDLKGHGLVPRDYSDYPAEMFDPPSDMPLIPESEYDARVEEQERRAASLEHLCTWSPKDQDGDGYCWGYSVTAAVEFLRVIAGMPLVRLSAHAICAIIKRGRNEGGWCGLSAKFAREFGIPAEDLWPTHSRDLRHDTPEMRANAALHRVMEEWVDLTRNVYDQNLTLRQVDSCCLANIPMAWDFNWWGHSVFGGRLVKVEAGSRGRRIRNSWGNWGENGWATLRGEKAIPNGAVALRVVTPSLN